MITDPNDPSRPSTRSGDLAKQALGTVHTLIEELNNREAHLQAILATVPDAMVVIDEKERASSSHSAQPRHVLSARSLEEPGETYCSCGR